MKTLIAMGKVAALFSSPLLLGLYVYDRSGGNLSSWLPGSKAAREVVRPHAATPAAAESVTEPALFPGSKSFCGATVIETRTLGVWPPAATEIPPVAHTPGSPNAAPTMFPGPKSAPAWAVAPRNSQPTYAPQQLAHPRQQPAPNAPAAQQATQR